MTKPKPSTFRVTNTRENTSVDVLVRNAASAMCRARRQCGWTNFGSDAEGYFGYEIHVLSEGVK